MHIHRWAQTLRKRLLHPASATDVIVLTSCVCLLPLACLNGQTYRPVFWYVGQVEGYLGQVQRSRSPGQKKSNGKWLELQLGRHKLRENVQ